MSAITPERPISDERQLTPEMRAELTQAVTKILAEMTPDERYAAVAEAAGVIKRERDEALALLREVEWVDSGDEYGTCPICEGYATVTPPDWLGVSTVNCHIGHAPDCRLAAALRGTP